MPERDLVARADALTEAVTTLAKSVTALAASQRRIKHVVVATVVGLVLDLALTVVVSLLFGSQRSVIHDLQQVQVRTSDEVLCPLYALFIAFEPRARDNPSFTPQERADRTHAYEVIHQGYATLGCH